jgi:hypothetical protein
MILCISCKMSEQQATTRTIARLPRCYAVAACGSNVLYCWCATDTQEARFLRIPPSGAVEALPFSYVDDDWTSIACSFDGNAIYIGTKSGILKKSPVWDSAPPEPLLLDQQGTVKQLRISENG